MEYKRFWKLPVRMQKRFWLKSFSFVDYRIRSPSPVRPWFECHAQYLTVWITGLMVHASCDRAKVIISGPKFALFAAVHTHDAKKWVDNLSKRPCVKFCADWRIFKEFTSIFVQPMSLVNWPSLQPCQDIRPIGDICQIALTRAILLRIASNIERQ